MELSYEDKESIKDILIEIYGSEGATMAPYPTKKTLFLIEEMFSKSAQCHAQTAHLMQNLHNGVVGGGNFLKEFKKIFKNSTKNISGAITCDIKVIAAYYKTKIYLSANNF